MEQEKKADFAFEQWKRAMKLAKKNQNIQKALKKITKKQKQRNQQQTTPKKKK